MGTATRSSTKMRRVEAWLTSDQVSWLRTIRTTEGVPVSAILRRAVSQYISRHISQLEVKKELYRRR
jgi:hypothetical protein